MKTKFKLYGKQSGTRQI